MLISSTAVKAQYPDALATMLVTDKALLSQVSVARLSDGNEGNGSPAIFEFRRSDSITTPLNRPLQLEYQLLGTAQAAVD